MLNATEVKRDLNIKIYQAENGNTTLMETLC